MTEENQKKLYEHFVKTSQNERAAEVLTRYPQFADTPEAPKEVNHPEEPEEKPKSKKVK